MPNRNGIHHEKNAKPLNPPPHRGMLLGYTGTLSHHPTVYFTLGHWTQTHNVDWNVGWDSYVGWECLFFGNVHHLEVFRRKDHNGKDRKVYNHSSNDRNGRLIETDAYVKRLETLGKNRFKGGKAEDLNNWKLDVNLDQNTQGELRLREFWIRKGKDGNREEDRFAHSSHHGKFTPVPHSEVVTRNLLENDLPKGWSKNAGITSENGVWVYSEDPRKSPIVLDWKGRL